MASPVWAAAQHPHRSYRAGAPLHCRLPAPALTHHVICLSTVISLPQLHPLYPHMAPRTSGRPDLGVAGLLPAAHPRRVSANDAWRASTLGRTDDALLLKYRRMRCDAEPPPRL
eukprot:scaffold50974_cov18-Tisochrysis_lutea.AAC.1